MFGASARTTITALAVATAGALALTGCSASAVLQTSGGSAGATNSSPTPKVSMAKVSFNVRSHAAKVSVDRKIRVRVADGQLQHVTLSGPGGQVPGALATNSATWVASALLSPASKYVVSGLTVDNEGVRSTFRRTFSTAKLTLNQQTYPSFVPADGSTVGIGMPVIIRFDVPVTDKASIEKHISVTSTPAQAGAFRWINDNELHWRPASYWKAGTTVHVAADIGGVPAGHGIWGQLNRQETFHIGRAQIIRVNLDTDQLHVVRNGQTIRTIPVTAGKEPQFTTRSGVKVIMEKDRRVDMNSETIGINPNSSDGYNLKGVEFAMRLTNSGEFLHAAPWSVAYQGHTNVSHGCTGMSTANAGWLYNHSIIGDPVEYTGTSRPMTLDNGYGDWNLSIQQYGQGSAA